jgi:hypothetical protein
MALRAVTDHPKFAHFKSILRLPRGAALGWLECMWHFCSRFTLRGNIGKYPDQAIEAWCEWDGEPGGLIAALIQSRWLDEDSLHRLLVHDWPDHADIQVHTELARKCLRFADGRIPQSGRLNEEERKRFRDWMDEEGEPAPTMGRPKIHHKSAGNQPKVRESEPEVSQKSEALPCLASALPAPSISNASHSHPAAEADGESDRPRRKRKVKVNRKDDANEELGITPEEIYQQYPRKIDKDNALKEIEKAIARVRKGKNGCPLIPDEREACKFLYRKVRAYAHSPDGTRPDTDFIPYPSSWFNKSRYLDDEESWNHTGEVSGHRQPQPEHLTIPRGPVTQAGGDD